MLLGFAAAGALQLELLQPLAGRNVYSDFLAEKGEGVHHLLFETADVESKLARLATRGIGVKMWGSALRPGAIAILVTHQFSLGEWEKAFRIARTKEGIKALLAP